MAKKADDKDTPAKRKGWPARIWHFLWYEDSVASWVVSIALAFILIKFVLYPGLGLVFGTQFPVVAVVSSSMEHDTGFDTWWIQHEDQYLQFNITREEFAKYPMRGGFDKGDIIILVGTKPADLERGDIIVYWGGKQYPIIHRIVVVAEDTDGMGKEERYFQTKGDNNLLQIVQRPYLDETHVKTDQVIGKAVVRVPYLGWVKIGFVSLLNSIGIPVS